MLFLPKSVQITQSQEWTLKVVDLYDDDNEKRSGSQQFSKQGGGVKSLQPKITDPIHSKKWNKSYL